MNEDRLKRIEEVISRCYKLARLVRRNFNKHLKIANQNFKNLDDNIEKNNEALIRITKILKELTSGEEVNLEVKEKKKINYYI